MTSKTKAELVAENTALKVRIGELEDWNENLRAQINLYSSMMDEDERDIEIYRSAGKKATDRHIAYKNATEKKLHKYYKGINKINSDALPRTEFIKEKFKHYREKGLNLTNARNKANEDLTSSDFKYTYSPRWLTANLKD